METLLFTTVQNKSGRDIITPVCFRYNFSSNVVALLLCCKLARIKGPIWRKLNSFEKDNCKAEYDNSSPVFYNRYRHQFYQQRFSGFFSNQKTT